MKNKNKYSKIIAGTMSWGSWGKCFSTAQMTDMMHHCLDLGITTFDHADIYGDYTNENDFGKAFFQSGIDRENIQIISKCGIQFNSIIRKNKIKHYNYSKDYIIWSTERSLKNLKTDYLDLLLLHRPSPLMHPVEIAEAVEKLKGEGKIRGFGVSNFTPSQIAMLETEIPISGNQVEFSLTANGGMYNGTLDDCLAHKRMAMSWSPLGTYYKEKNRQRKRIEMVLTPLTKKYKVSGDQLLLAWILKHPAAVFPVVGTASKDRLQAASEALNINLELEDWFGLLAASQGHEVP
tara:strand:+ start:7679 stop:8554 length:876 start_codon:yes stop_codon:yes gene_type:complete